MRTRQNYSVCAFVRKRSRIYVSTIPQDLAHFVMTFVDRVQDRLECVLGGMATGVNEDCTSVIRQNYHRVNHIGFDSVIGETLNVICSANETDSFVN